jgi:ADP-heptose:LPS heptosyltransferase
MKNGSVLEAPPSRVAVLRALRGLGDLLCAVPALRAMRSAWPAAHVTVIGLPSGRWLLERFPSYVDDYLDFPGFPGVPEVPVDNRRLLTFLDEVQGRFDLALQLHGSGSHSNAFTALLGARTTAGFYLPSLWRPDDRTFFPYPAHAQEVRRWLELLDNLGLPTLGDEMEFPVWADDIRRLESVWPAAGNGSYVCLHPGAFEPERRWPTERFARVADELAAQGFEVVLTGTAAEADLTGEVRMLMSHPATDLAGRTDLGSLAALFEGAELLVSNDTGVSHLAAALRTRSVVVFSASDPHRWAPLDRNRHRPVGEVMPQRVNGCVHAPDVRGHRCLRDACSSLAIAHDEAWRPAPVDLVLEEALGLLAATPPEP